MIIMNFGEKAMFFLKKLAVFGKAVYKIVLVFYKFGKDTDNIRI